MIVECIGSRRRALCDAVESRQPRADRSQSLWQTTRAVFRARTTLRYYDVRYRGNVRANLIGTWPPGVREPLWVIADLTPERSLDLYRRRIQIEETFQDVKTL